ncbi:hypothetical protein NBRGN_066_00610 [Nocardia brasiliensis NBRC 14402]|nr:spirocyclase, AveC family [Nocardia brasiliensis]GAJ83836.1 hypothetical protein NBRGN_066_00610 [Nocardia brasiliensis NBRC 14402]SUB54131.1 Uncharacterised protein [Nocardia brasiliensis]
MNDDGTNRVRCTPAVCFAALGALFVAFQGVVFARWIAGGGAHPVPRDYPISTLRAAQTWAGQVITILLVVLCVVVAWRSSRKAGEITFDTALIAGYATTFWISPLANAHGPVAVQNRYALNLTAWGPYIPGWDGPRTVAMSETLVLAGGLMYIPLIVWYWIQIRLVKQLLRFRPQWGMARLTPAVLLLGLLVDIPFEIALIAGTAGYGYPFADQTSSLFGGHWYQLPLGAIVAGMFMPSLAALVWTHAQVTKSRFVIFRGDEQLAPRARGWARLLAGVTLANISLLLWALTQISFSKISPDPMPADFPSWLWPR